MNNNTAILEKDFFRIIKTDSTFGVEASKAIISEDLLEDILDLIYYANPKIIAELNNDFLEAKKNNDWVDGEKFLVKDILSRYQETNSENKIDMNKRNKNGISEIDQILYFKN